MDSAEVKLTVLFQEPFWAGVFERTEKGELTVCRVVFGAEPKDAQIYEFILKQYDRLKFSPAVEAFQRTAADSPKRRQRSAKKELSPGRIGTKSQQALQLQREQGKLERRRVSREQREAERARRFSLKQQKQKEKHRGR